MPLARLRHLLLAGLLGSAPTLAVAWPQLSLRAPVAGFVHPTHVTHAGDGSGRMFVTEQAGRAWIVRDQAVLPVPFLDIDARVGQVLHGIAFPPGYAQNGWFYVKYVDPAGTVILARYLVSADPDRADPQSEQVVLAIAAGAESGWGHSGGAPAFSPGDGYLYLAMGDGDTNRGDPEGHAQDPADLRGKLLRIDVESGLPPTYTVPPTNPFLGDPAYRPEIWAVGFRNPWRIAFDRLTHDLYIGDVGQGRFEEIDHQPAASGGGENYGWRLLEGSHCYEPNPCDPTGLVLPVHEYDHAEGCSVTGGVMARGLLHPGLEGIYFLGDYCQGKIWGLRPAAAPGAWESALLLAPGFRIISFGEDEAGEVHVADYDEGVVYRLSDQPPAAFVLTVAGTGGGSGSVASRPAGISCGADCAETFAAGELRVRLTATAGAGSVFAGFSGDPDCADGVVTMTTSRSCSARFELGPDLVIAALSAPATGGAGYPLTVTDTTRNQGVGGGAAATTRFYLSANPTWDAGDALLGGREVGALAAGASSSAATPVTLPPGTATGSYYILARADALGIVAEVSETNNNRASAVVRIGPDLQLTAVATPATGGAGRSITVTDTARNGGGGDAAASRTSFYLSANSGWDAGDVLLGGRDLSLLAPAASSPGATPLVLPAGTATGTYYVIGRADAPAAVAETSESNNARASGPIKVGPDLIVSALTAPALGGAGRALAVTDTTRDQGAGDAAPSRTQLYLSTNKTWDAGDLPLGGREVAALAAGAASSATTSVTLPAETAPGTYHVIARGDDLAAVAETTESNNARASAAVKVGPDLLVTALTVPSSGRVGGSLAVNDTTRNQGQGDAAPSRTSFYLSADATWQASDVLLGGRDLAALLPSASSQAVTPLTIPAGTAPGSYRILARADDPAAVIETIESNNLRASAAVRIDP